MVNGTNSPAAVDLIALIALAGCSDETATSADMVEEPPAASTPEEDESVPGESAPNETAPNDTAPTATTPGVDSPIGPMEGAPPDEEVLLPVDEPSPPPEVEDSSCASASVASRIPPVTLLFVLDTSFSMASAVSRSQRWEPVTVALKAFAEDTGSEGLSAAVHLFPQPGPTGVDTPVGRFSCDPVLYSEPSWPLTDLPDGSGMDDFLRTVTPRGPTPTVPALSGAILQAEELLAADSETRVAVVLVSDGEPGLCDNSDPPNTVDGASGVVAGVADRIPTYVIGVGNRLENLHQIAQAGGTTEALIIDPVDPEVTRTQILDRLAESVVRWFRATCSSPSLRKASR